MAIGNRLMVMFKGPSGVVRAWAVGASDDRENTRSRAKASLDKYRKERANLGDTYMATCDYTESVVSYRG